ncbi:MAG TPA: hypothetical protein VK694_08215 [Verrucomicrobiae bacterium]|nr:hypothetical protein [Verrucomicrobiae bacterium]
MNKAAIIAQIEQEFSQRFRVIDNTGTDKKVVAGQFPDVIMMRPEPPPNSDILFVMKIESGENLVDSVAEWKELGSGSGVLYIIVPDHRLDLTKKLASATNVRARFAAYTTAKDGTVTIRYE